MNRLIVLASSMLLFYAMTATPGSAQSSSTPQSPATFGGWDGHEITVTGTIQEVIAQHALGGPAGLHFQLQSLQGVFDVSVGPYLTTDTQQELTIGQQVQVVGIVKTLNGSDCLLARQLVLSGHLITIRSEHGFLVPTQSRAGSRAPLHQGAANGGTQ